MMISGQKKIIMGGRYGLLTLFAVFFLDLSDSVEGQQVRFFLFTRNNRYSSREISVNDTDSDLRNKNYEPKYPTKITVHGFTGHMNVRELQQIREEYLKRGPTNVIAVDWETLATGPALKYPVAVRNVAKVGKRLAELIGRLKDYGSRDIHILGYSLGAHVAAVAAKHLKPYNVPRITGLDPAGPLSSLPTFLRVFLKPDKELDNGDADFVDVYHTETVIQGMPEPCGHVDFYMNGGKSQPGCKNIGCSHERAPEYFAESINTKDGFWSAYPSAVLAGDSADKSIRGRFDVPTNAKRPFALGRSKYLDSDHYSHIPHVQYA